MSWSSNEVRWPFQILGNDLSPIQPHWCVLNCYMWSCAVHSIWHELFIQGAPKCSIWGWWRRGRMARSKTVWFHSFTVHVRVHRGLAKVVRASLQVGFLSILSTSGRKRRLTWSVQTNKSRGLGWVPGLPLDQLLGGWFIERRQQCQSLLRASSRSLRSNEPTCYSRSESERVRRRGRLPKCQSESISTTFWYMAKGPENGTDPFDSALDGNMTDISLIL